MLLATGVSRWNRLTRFQHQVEGRCPLLAIEQQVIRQGACRRVCAFQRAHLELHVRVAGGQGHDGADREGHWRCWPGQGLRMCRLSSRLDCAASRARLEFALPHRSGARPRGWSFPGFNVVVILLPFPSSSVPLLTHAEAGYGLVCPPWCLSRYSGSKPLTRTAVMLSEQPPVGMALFADCRAEILIPQSPRFCVP